MGVCIMAVREMFVLCTFMEVCGHGCMCVMYCKALCGLCVTLTPSSQSVQKLLGFGLSRTANKLGSGGFMGAPQSK